MARPSSYSQKIADKILDRISDGQMLIKICQEDGMPPRKTVYAWMDYSPAFAASYARARLAWADWWAERVMIISVDPAGAVETDGKVFLDNAAIMWAKHLTDNAKWLVGKYAPRTYGEKAELPPADNTGNEITEIRRTIVSVIHDDNGSSINADDNNALRARIKELEERLGMKEGTLPPRQLTYDPGPLPASVAPELRVRFARIIQDTIPDADKRSPDEVLALALDVFARAMKAEFGADEAA